MSLAPRPSSTGAVVGALCAGASMFLVGLAAAAPAQRARAAAPIIRTARMPDVFRRKGLAERAAADAPSASGSPVGPVTNRSPLVRRRRFGLTPSSATPRTGSTILGVAKQG